VRAIQLIDIKQLFELLIPLHCIVVSSFRKTRLLPPFLPFIPDDSGSKN
jgi:hypothetical protein